MSKLLSAKEAAKMLGYHPTYFRLLLRRGVIKGHKLGGFAWMIDRDEVDRVKREQENGRLYVERPD